MFGENTATMDIDHRTRSHGDTIIFANTTRSGGCDQVEMDLLPVSACVGVSTDIENAEDRAEASLELEHDCRDKNRFSLDAAGH